ncbi:MAG: hypothetical protein QGH45_12780, partial [Myxococcota bacterium]|nr:hypothetical protein [Myxococcota bacterium]
MRPLTLNTLLLALALLLCAPPPALAAPPEEEDDGDEEGDEGEAQDASTQSQPPKMLLDPRRAPVERRGNAKGAMTKKADDEGERESKEKDADDENGEDDAADKGLAGQDEPVVGGGDGQWSTTGATGRKESVRPPRDTKVNIDFVDTDLKDVVKYFAEITGRNFVIAD